jgi:hypothetical protein
MDGINMKILRLLLFKDCNRNCEGCCNKNWNLDKLPVETDFSSYDEILLTGGEPMLHPKLVEKTIYDIRQQNKKAKIYMYTADSSMKLGISSMLLILDGVTITLHDQCDVLPFIELSDLIAMFNYRKQKSLRLNIFSGIQMDYSKIKGWVIKNNIEWIKNCHLPEHEVFKRLM